LIRTLRNNWWLLAMAGLLDAIISAIYFIMQETNGPVAFHSWNTTVELLGKLALAAGACTIAAGVWRSAAGPCWLLVLNGLGLGALGLIQYQFTHRPISFLTIALLVVLMAVSLGLLDLAIARAWRRERHPADGWLLAFAGAASAGFALVFLALGLRWIRMDPRSHPDLLWLGCYFGFTAICTLWLTLRLHRHGLSPLGNPRFAH